MVTACARCGAAAGVDASEQITVATEVGHLVRERHDLRPWATELDSLGGLTIPAWEFASTDCRACSSRVFAWLEA